MGEGQRQDEAIAPQGRGAYEGGWEWFGGSDRAEATLRTAVRRRRALPRENVLIGVQAQGPPKLDSYVRRQVSRGEGILEILQAEPFDTAVFHLQQMRGSETMGEEDICGSEASPGRSSCFSSGQP